MVFLSTDRERALFLGSTQNIAYGKDIVVDSHHIAVENIPPGMDNFKDKSEVILPYG